MHPSEGAFRLEFIGLLWILTAIWCISSTTATIDRIVIVVRHGDRAPLQPFPWDGPAVWRQGYGHLTNNGKQRMYRLGVFLRTRYAPHFAHSDGSQSIRPRDVYIRSSAIERCLESAQLIAAGLCPPKDEWKWNAEIGGNAGSSDKDSAGNLGSIWQPVPVHSAPQAEDGLLVPSSNCKRAIALYGRVPDSEVVKKFMAPLEATFSSVSNATGVRVTSYREARAVYDSLLSARHHLVSEETGLVSSSQLAKAASWPTKEQKAALKAAFEAGFHFDYSGAIEPEMVRLRAGLLLREIFSRLEANSSSSSASASTSSGNLFCGHRRLSIFSTHDSALLYLLDALGLRPAHTLLFGSALLFEIQGQAREVSLHQIQAVRSTDPLSPIELHFPLGGSEKGGKKTTSQPKKPSLEQLKAHYGPLMVDSTEQWRRECDQMDGLSEEKLRRGRAEL